MEIIEEIVKRVPAAFQVIDERLEWSASTLQDWLATEDLRVSHNKQGRSSHTASVSQFQKADNFPLALGSGLSMVQKGSD